MKSIGFIGFIGFILSFFLFFFPVSCWLYQGHLWAQETFRPKERFIASIDISLDYSGGPPRDYEGRELVSYIKYLFDVQKGDLYEEKKIERGLERLKSLSIFSSIKLEKEDFPDGLHLRLCLEKQRIIREISILGNYPLFESEVRKVVSARVGDFLDLARLEKNANDIKWLFQQEGYYQVQVFLDLGEEKNENEVMVTFLIAKGPRTRIQQVEFEENGIVVKEYEDWQKILGIYPGYVLQEYKLKNQLQKLENELVLQGYLKVKASYQINHLSERYAILKILLERSQGIEVRFEGNQKISDQHLRRKISLFENRSGNEFDLQESLEDIRQIYLSYGFLLVKVSYHKEITAQGREVVSFLIEEGDKIILENLEIKGNQGLSTESLKDQMVTLQTRGPFVQSGFNKIAYDEDIGSLKALYTFEGYPWVEIEDQESLKGHRLSKILYIHEGPRVVVGDLTFAGNHFVPESTLKEIISLKTGSFFSEEKWQKDRERLIIFYSNQGHVFATVSPKASLDKEKNLINLYYQIDEGPEAFFGKYLISRKVKTRRRVIRQSLTFTEGEPFSYQKIIDSTQKLNDLGIFRTVLIKPVNLESGEQHIDVAIEVEERRTGRLNVGLGYNSVKGYRGYAEYREHSVAGSSLGMSLRYEYSGIGEGYELTHDVPPYQKISFEMKDPLFIPYYKIEGSLDLFNIFEKKEGYTLQQTGLKIGLGKPLSKTTCLSFIYRFEEAKLRQVKIDPNGIEFDPTIISVKPLLTYDSRDNPLDPKTGVLAQLGLEMAGDPVGGESHFSKLQGNGAHFFPLSRQATLAFGFTGGYAWIRKLDEFPIQERFYTGGLNTVRGYPEDSLGPTDNDGDIPTGGCVLLVQNCELRHDLYRRLKGVLFFDAGNVWETKDEFNLKTLRTGAGLGLRVITPVGPIRLDYGWIINRKEEERVGKLYLSVGHVF